MFDTNREGQLYEFYNTTFVIVISENANSRISTGGMICLWQDTLEVVDIFCQRAEVALPHCMYKQSSGLRPETIHNRVTLLIHVY